MEEIIYSPKPCKKAYKQIIAQKSVAELLKHKSNGGLT